MNKAAEYGRIVDDKNFNRVEKLLQDALKKGAKIEFGGQHKKEEKFMEPTLLTNVNTGNADHARRNIWSIITHYHI